MNVNQFSDIVSQIKPHTGFVYFHVKGEPLIHPDLEQFLTICYENQLRVNLTTNGILLKKHQNMLLNHPGLRQVNISLHADLPSQYDSSDYISSAISFAKLANEKGIYVVFRLWNLDKDNNTDSKSLEIMNYIENAFHLEKPLIESMGGRQSVKISSYVFVGWEQEFEWPSLDHDFVSDIGYCYGMRHQIAILVDGTVVPCCLDCNGEAALGNVFIDGFSNIIQTKRAKAIKHGFENSLAVDELCKHCSFRTKFNEYI